MPIVGTLGTRNNARTQNGVVEGLCFAQEDVTAAAVPVLLSRPAIAPIHWNLANVLIRARFFYKYELGPGMRWVGAGWKGPRDRFSIQLIISRTCECLSRYNMHTYIDVLIHLAHCRRHPVTCPRRQPANNKLDICVWAWVCGHVKVLDMEALVLGVVDSRYLLYSKILFHTMDLPIKLGSTVFYFLIT